MMILASIVDMLSSAWLAGLVMLGLANLISREHS